MRACNRVDQELLLTGGRKEKQKLDRVHSSKRNISIQIFQGGWRTDSMQAVDLTLAVNYLPACACLVKLILFLIALAMVPPGEEILGGYMILAAGLYLDRTLAHNIIFDGNAILVAVFVSNVHAAIRASASSMAPSLVVMGVGHLIWAAGCAILIADPPLIRQLIMESHPLNAKRLPPGGKLAPVCTMLVATVTTAHFRGELEPAPVRACRALGFTLVSFAWIYIVGIHSSQGVGYLKENSWQFIARLAPILYSPIWVVTLFCPAIAWALVMQHSSRQKQAQSPYQYSPLPPVSCDDPPVLAHHHTPKAPPPASHGGAAGESPLPDPEAQIVEELLRQAKQQASVTAKNRTVIAEGGTV